MVGVYGATGMLGRLVADRLDRMKTETTLIGRSASALEASVHRPRQRTAVAQPGDTAAIEQALNGCRVVVNCAPAETPGDALVRAALDAGIHYVDAAGDQQQIRRIFETYDAEANQCDVAIVPAFGFDYAIGDCLARLAARSHEPAEEIVIAYSIDSVDVTSNSVGGVSGSAGGREVVYRDSRWRPVPFELDRASFEFPPPIGRRQMSRYGSGEVITVPRHTTTRSVRTLITSTSLCPHPALLPVFPALRPVMGLVRRTPARALLAFAAGMLTKPPGGADEANRTGATRTAGQSPTSDDHRRFIVVAEARGTDASVGRAIATGGNFHAVTAALLAQAAVWLAAGSVVAGVRSAATAFEPEAVLDSLALDGVAWRINSR